MFITQIRAIWSSLLSRVFLINTPYLIIDYMYMYIKTFRTKRLRVSHVMNPFTRVELYSHAHVSNRMPVPWNRCDHTIYKWEPNLLLGVRLWDETGERAWLGRSCSTVDTQTAKQMGKWMSELYATKFWFVCIMPACHVELILLLSVLWMGIYFTRK